MPNYPSPPARRKAYDRDDTAVVSWWRGLSGVFSHDGLPSVDDMNDEGDSVVKIGDVSVRPAEHDPGYVAFIFAGTSLFRLLHVKASFVEVGASISITSVDIEYSVDTTNGRDGTWVTIQTGIVYDSGQPASPNYRTSIQSVGDTVARKGYRFKFNASGGLSGQSVDIRTIHLYGNEPLGPDQRLRFVEATDINVEIATDFDFLDVARGSEWDKQFRVRNMSIDDPVSNITLVVEQGPSQGELSEYVWLSLDGVTFSKSLPIGFLGAGAASVVIYLRAQIPVSAVLHTWVCRVTPTGMSWG